MKSVIEKTVHEIEIKNSKFICCLYPIDSDDIVPILHTIKKEYPKATHYCYAYIFQDISHSSDDGEPGGTAGMPILNVLTKENLSNVLCVVIRYFGGIKLGAGGLVRAYTKSVTETLKEASFQELVSGYKIQISFSYSDEKNIQMILGNSSIVSRKFLDDITYVCYVDEEIFTKLERFHPIILEKCFIKKLNNC